MPVLVFSTCVEYLDITLTSPSSRAQQIAAETGKSREFEEAITQTGTITSCEGFCITPGRTCEKHDTCCTAFRDQHECISGKCTACGDLDEPACSTTDFKCNYPYKADEAGVCKKEKDDEEEASGVCLALREKCSLSTSSCCSGSLCLLKKCHACGTAGNFCCF